MFHLFVVLQPKQQSTLHCRAFLVVQEEEVEGPTEVNIQQFLSLFINYSEL